MPKSKRNKQVELAKTKKRGLEWKKGLFEEVRSCVDKYANVFVFSVSDMRNAKMKNVRDQWKDSRFFIGKNKIMAMALGRFAEEEYKPNLHKLGQQIKGQRGLLFSNKPLDEVLSWFRSYSEGDYVRSGNVATETVNLPAGPLTMFPHNQEPYLRQLGLPTSLVKGVIHLIKDHEVCEEGDVLTPETAKILKLLQYEMAEFHITIECVWSQDASFMQLAESINTDTKENVKEEKKTSLDGKNIGIVSNSQDTEEMEVELDENASEVELNENASEVELNGNASEVELNGNASAVELNGNAPEVELNDNASEVELNDNASEVELNDNASEVELNDNASEVELNENVPEVELHENASEVELNDDSDGHEDENNTDINSKSPPKEECSGSKDKKRPHSELEELDKNISESTVEKFVISHNESVDVNDNRTLSTKKSRLTRKSTKSKKVSLPKTPDANTSQDSPVFRQLRNRSVNMSAKKRK